MSNIIKIELKPIKKLFYDNDFGIYACEMCEFHPDIQLNQYGNFVIKGKMGELVIGQKHIAELTEFNNVKRGKEYIVSSIYQEIPTTIKGQHILLRAILAPSYAEALIEAFPETDIISAIKNDELDYRKAKGIGDKTYEKIKNKIIENIEMQEALIELSQYDITYTMIKKIVKHFESSASLAVQMIKENPYILCEVDGLGFIKVDVYAKKMGIKEDSPERIYAAIEYALRQEEVNGHCWVEIDEIINKTTQLTNVKEEKIRKYIENIDNKRFYKDDKRIALRINYEYEKNIAECILELQKHSGNFKVENVEEKIKQVEKETGLIYTKEQVQAVYKAIENNVLIISGKAGTGKSTLLKLIMRVLDGYTYSTCAFSGKAAQRITESTGLRASTIHRLLAYHPRFGFMFNKDEPLQCHIVDLDEGSMVPLHLFDKLVSAIQKGRKFIILGDIEQLPPIGAGNVMRDLIESGVVPVVELTEVHRQALKSGILLTANLVRDGKQITDRYESKAKSVGELKDLFMIPKNDGGEIYEYIKNLCEKSKDQFDLMDFQVIVPMREKTVISVRSFNLMLQKIFNPEDKPKIKKNGYEFKEGDKVIQVGNDYNKGIFNGTLGIIKSIDEEERIAEVQFVSQENPLILEYSDFDNIDMAYALTVHRTQGSQFRHVIFALDYSAYKLLSKQFVYTALTRTSEKCVFVFENRALRYAISQDHSVARNTFLKELLVNMKNREEVTSS